MAFLPFYFNVEWERAKMTDQEDSYQILHSRKVYSISEPIFIERPKGLSIDGRNVLVFITPVRKSPGYHPGL